MSVESGAMERPGQAWAATTPAEMSPLAETLARISAASPYLDYLLQSHLPRDAGDGNGDGGQGSDGGEWRWLPELADPALLGAWHAQLAERVGDRRAAAAYMAGWLSSTLVSIWLLPALVDRRLPLAPRGAIAVRRNPDGWFDGILLANDTLGLLAVDPRAGWPGATVLADERALLDGVAQRLLALEPVIDALRAACPIGVPALWGGVADMVGLQALLVATTLRRDERAAWEEAEGLLDRLRAGQPRMRARPRVVEVAWAGGSALASVRGTCCLFHRTCADPDPDGEGFCDACPLRTDTSRLARLRAALEAQ